MFETYMESGRSDTARHRMLLVSGALACALTSTSLASMWASGKLRIDRVAAPAIDWLAVQVAEVMPPPPVEPPPAPPPDETRNEIPDDAPSQADGRAAVALASTPESPGTSALRRDGAAGDERVPGLPSRSLFDGPATGIPPWRTRSSGDPPGGRGDPPRGGGGVARPLSVLMEQKIYTPDPDPRKLMATRSGRVDRRPGDVKIQFCVGTDGKVSRAKVARGFRDDPEVDRIVKEAVSRWRFRPVVVGGKPMEVCSAQTFRVVFD